MSSDPHIDARLRAVPLPPGLVERLRQIALADDAGLDAALRAVALPPGMLDRLRAVAWASDEDLDAALRDLPLPPALGARLRSAAWEEDADLDAAVAGVPVPAGLQRRLRAIPLADDAGLDAALADVPAPTAPLAKPWRRLARRKRLVLWTQIAVAASLVIVLAGFYFFADRLGGLVAMFNGTSSPTQPKTRKGEKPVEMPLTRSLASTGRDAGGTGTTGVDATATWRAPVAKISLARNEAGSPGQRDLLPSDLDPLAGLEAARPSALEHHSFGSELPEPKRALGLIPRGLDWPLVPGANHAFLLKYRVHPFVSPAAGARLQSMLVPLGADGASYELTRRYLADRQLPPPDQVRTEDFLAAMKYPFARPAPGTLGLSLAGGPSPFGGEGFCLLQVGVQAGAVPPQPHPPTHLILLVDTSASMAWGGRLDMVRRAIIELGGKLDAADRLTLVSFGDHAQVLLPAAGPGNADQEALAAAARSLEAKGSTNVTAGLGQACLTARQAAATTHAATRIVLLTDGMLDLPPASTQQLGQPLAQAAAEGIAFHVIDLGQDRQSEPELPQLAAAGHGAVHRAANADQVYWALREVLTGQSQLVARDAQLRVTFNPRVVREYRLLGHEAKALAGLMPERLQADFHDGQAATVLYEVRLAPNVTGEEVAQVELTWQNTNDGGPLGAEQRAGQAITAAQFAAGFAQAAPSLQEAALAAQFAELLRRSPFVRTPRPAKALNSLLDLAAAVDSRLAQQPAFRDFVDLAERATHARPAAAHGRTNPRH